MKRTTINGELIRTVVFRPYRKGYGPVFTLKAYDLNRRDHLNKHMLGYRLLQSGYGEVFTGEDVGCSPMDAIDSDASVAAIMGFLTLRPGDTDREYFDDYTPEQLAYCGEHAEALSSAVYDRFGED